MFTTKYRPATPRAREKVRDDLHRLHILDWATLAVLTIILTIAWPPALILTPVVLTPVFRSIHREATRRLEHDLAHGRILRPTEPELAME